MKEMMGVKMEDIANGSSSSSSSSSSPSFPSYSFSLPSVFDLSVEKSSVGFMELLGVQQNYSSNYSAPPPLDFPFQLSNPASAGLKEEDPHPHDDEKECSEVLNNSLQQQQPATPNSSSISSASSDEHNNTLDQAKEQPQKQLKAAKKTKEKRQIEARFAFMTKSEVDHLEDGYRWRKYGQKAVKNSPFPRSYYRCTSASCNVKKRVERSLTDPTIVVTTYEGQHTHPSSLMQPPCSVVNHHAAAARLINGSQIFPPPNNDECTTNFGSLLMPAESYMSQYYYQHHQQVLMNTLSSLGFPNSKNVNATSPQERPLCINPLRDHGLLQDVVPSHMFKEDQK